MEPEVEKSERVVLKCNFDGPWYMIKLQVAKSDCDPWTCQLMGTILCRDCRPLAVDIRALPVDEVARISSNRHAHLSPPFDRVHDAILQ